MESRVRPLLRPYLSLLIILPSAICGEISNINQMIRSINSEMLSTEEILSDHAYLYQVETGQLTSHLDDKNIREEMA